MPTAQAEQASRLLAGRFLRELRKSPEPAIQYSLAMGVEVASRHIPPGEACALLEEAFAGTTDPWAQHWLAYALSVAAGKRPTARAREVCRPVTDCLISALGPEASPPGGQTELAAALVAVTSRLPPWEAAECLERALTRTTEVEVLGKLVPALAQAFERLASPETMRICRRATGRFLEAFGRAAEPWVKHWLAEAVAGSAGHLLGDHRCDGPLQLILVRATNALHGDGKGFHPVWDSPGT
jgi:hypothetical protein